MKIGEYSPVGKSSGVGKKKSAGGTSSASSDFMGLLSANEVESVLPTAPPSDIQPVTSMDALLSLQEMPDDEIKKRRAVQESNSTLEALETLRHALLSGSIPEYLLTRLSKVVALQKQRVSDPALASLIQDIELRAAVELAKLERATHKS